MKKDFPLIVPWSIPSSWANVCLLVLLAVAGHAQTIRYVAKDNPAAAAPYADWTTAAPDIQTAIDAASPGDEIIVSNGVYDTGGRFVDGQANTNRVVIDKAVTVRSLNGPAETIIKGFKDSVGTNAEAGIRCVLMTNGAALAGFTLMDGMVLKNSGKGGGVLCLSTNAAISNCVFTGNSACVGGGVCQGTIRRSTFINNSAIGGGAATESILYNCLIAENSATWFGGGCAASIVNNCTIIRNRAGSSSGVASSSVGNGVGNSTMNQCIEYANVGQSIDIVFLAESSNSCINPLPIIPFDRNIMTNEPRIVSRYNPRLLPDSPCINAGLDGEMDYGAYEYVSGVQTGPLSAAITATWTNFATGYDCEFIADIEGECIGYDWHWGDGTASRNDPFARHAYSVPGVYPVLLLASNLTHTAVATVTVNVVEQPIHYVRPDGGHASPYTNWTDAANTIQDAVEAACVPGALILVNDGIYETGGRPLAGYDLTNRVTVDKPIHLRSANGPSNTIIKGYSDTATSNSVSSVRCVYLGQESSISGFTLSEGATQISDPRIWPNVRGGGIYCEYLTSVVSNCIITGNSGYAGGGVFGGTVKNCSVRNNHCDWSGSVFGSIVYDSSICSNFGAYYGGISVSYVLNSLIAFNSATNGDRSSFGAGGASACIMQNCCITKNTATGSNAAGGAGYCSELQGCWITHNMKLPGTSQQTFGVANLCKLVNCLVAGNQKGGVYWSSLYNSTVVQNEEAGVAFALACYGCIVYNNFRFDGLDYIQSNLSGSSSSNSCATDAMVGMGNITNNPIFVDPGSGFGTNFVMGDYRLASNSPCINSGLYQPWMAGAVDMDGNPRVFGASADMGAYEYIPSQYTIPSEWLAQYGLATNGSSWFVDTDGDSMNNWQEWRAGTVPTNAQSVFYLSFVPSAESSTYPIVLWPSVTDRTYTVARSTNLWAQPPFTPIASNLPGEWPITVYTDQLADVSCGLLYYRISVE